MGLTVRAMAPLIKPEEAATAAMKQRVRVSKQVSDDFILIHGSASTCYPITASTLAVVSRTR